MHDSTQEDQSICVLHSINKMKEKPHMVISGFFRAFGKVYCRFVIKKSQELEIERNLFNTIKGVCEKPAGHLTLKAKRLNTLPRSGSDSMPAFTSASQRCPGSSSCSNETRKRSKTLWVRIAKEEVKLYLPMT